MSLTEWIAFAGAMIAALGLLWTVFAAHAKKDDLREAGLRASIEAAELRGRESLHKVKNELGANIITLQNIAADERRELNKAILDLQTILSKHQIQVASQYHTKAEMREMMESAIKPIRDSLASQNQVLESIRSMVAQRRRELDAG